MFGSSNPRSLISLKRLLPMDQTELGLDLRFWRKLSLAPGPVKRLDGRVGSLELVHRVRVYFQ
jgi:hypothetical protein